MIFADDGAEVIVDSIAEIDSLAEGCRSNSVLRRMSVWSGSRASIVSRTAGASPGETVVEYPKGGHRSRRRSGSGRVEGNRRRGIMIVLSDFG